MRLGFHYHIPACLIEGKIYTASNQGVFIDSLATHFEQVVLFLHSPRAADELSQMDYPIRAKNVTLVQLPKHLSIPRRLLIAHRIAKQVAHEVRHQRVEIMLFRAPTPILPFLVKATQHLCKHALLVVGDLREHVSNLGQPWWREGLVRRYIFWNEGRQEELSKNMLVFTNSEVIRMNYIDRAQKTVLVRTTTLSQSDFFQRNEISSNLPFKILYTGRIEQGKGLLVIAEAVALLHQQGLDCQWDIVGWSEPGNHTQAQIQDILDRLGLGEKVVFHGKKKVGEELFAFYRSADVYVMASLLSEGFPRTIWEALANSLPVITTPVGSIPYYLKDGQNALFVNPNPLDIAEKIKQLALIPELRKRLIDNGMKTVGESTLEYQSEKMANEIRGYLLDIVA